MMICATCSRPANKKVTMCDDWGRPRDQWCCDDHDPTDLKKVNGGEEAQREYFERRGFK